MGKRVLLNEWAIIQTPVIGMVHLPPLPGSPRWGGDLAGIEQHALRDAEALAEGGVDGLMLENFGDHPFFPRRVPAHTATHMTALATSIRRRLDLPLGINVLRNDGLTALAVAHASGAAFIRVNVLSGARVTDQGVLQGIAHDLLRARALLRAEEIKILADVNVKHSAPLGEVRLEHEVEDLLGRGGADAVIVSGTGTGKAANVDELKRVREAAGEDVPVLVGSGVREETVTDYLAMVDGLIVGSFFKVGGVTERAVDTARVKALLKRIRS